MAINKEQNIAIDALEKMSDIYYAPTQTERLAMKAVLDEFETAAATSALNALAFPRFKYNLTTPYTSKYGFITLGNEIICEIDNTQVFYSALGFNEDIRNNMLAEEFVWNEFHKDGSSKSEICLQARIISYLSRRLGIGIEKIEERKYWLGKCSEKRLTGFEGCNSCHCNPSSK